MYYTLFSPPPNILVSLDKAFCSGAVPYWIYAILQMWCVVLFIRQDMYFLQKNTELFHYEEPFKITTVTKKIADYLLFIHISLTDCTVHFYLHLYTSTVQSYIPNLKVKAFLFPIQNSGSTPAGRKRMRECCTALDHFHFSPKASKAPWWQDTTRTVCRIPPAAPFEKSSLLHSPVLCHSALWAMVCKMKRQLHDLVLLIKGSTLTVYLWPTLKYYRVFILH